MARLKVATKAPAGGGGAKEREGEIKVATVKNKTKTRFFVRHKAFISCRIFLFRD